MATVEQEVAAIGAVLGALEPLSPEGRAAVLEYVTKRLSITMADPRIPAPPPAGVLPDPQGLPAQMDRFPIHIKELKEQKKPKSAQEMAALVAYFLSELAPASKRKATVNGKDIETYFKIAEFKLPEQPRYTLPNAKKAGYLDQAGDGEYRLNPVGYNLVVHSLPRGSGKTSRARKRSNTTKSTMRRAKRA